MSSFRYDKEKVDLDVASSEAALLNEAIGSGRLDHDFVAYVLGTRSVCQLRATFDFYEVNYGNPIEQVGIVLLIVYTYCYMEFLVFN